jgi:hypothetical protein
LDKTIFFVMTKLFDLISEGNISLIKKEEELNNYIPYLTQLYKTDEKNEELFKLLKKYSQVETVLSYQKINFNEMEIEIKDELNNKIRKKSIESVFLQSLETDLTFEFENGNSETKIRLKYNYFTFIGILFKLILKEFSYMNYVNFTII